MNRLKTMITLAVLALWLPATNHCRLELIPALEFLACCVHENAAPHEDKDCETDGCATVEEGFYKSDDLRITPVAPDFLLSAHALTLAVASSHPFYTALPTTAPPELSKVWQFSFRAAAPPRAPSLLS
jgi:hypothetical protein